MLVLRWRERRRNETWRWLPRSLLLALCLSHYGGDRQRPESTLAGWGWRRVARAQRAKEGEKESGGAQGRNGFSVGQSYLCFCVCVSRSTPGRSRTPGTAAPCLWPVLQGARPTRGDTAAWPQREGATAEGETLVGGRNEGCGGESSLPGTKRSRSHWPAHGGRARGGWLKRADLKRERAGEEPRRRRARLRRTEKNAPSLLVDCAEH